MSSTGHNQKKCIDRARTDADNSNMGTSAKQRKTADKPLGYKERRKRLLMLLPKHGFKVAPAAIEAGFSETYAKRHLPSKLNADSEFTYQLDRMREQDCRSAEKEVDAVDAKLRNILDEPGLTTSMQLKAIELYYRRHGLLTDKQVIESGDRARELTEVQQSEARKLSILLMKDKGKSEARCLQCGAWAPGRIDEHHMCPACVTKYKEGNKTA